MDAVKPPAPGSSKPDPVEESLYEMDAVRVAQQGIRELPGSLAEAIEELPLQILAIFGVEQGEVRVAVHLQPLLLSTRAQKALEVAARM